MRKGYEWLMIGLGLSAGVMLGALCLLVGSTLPRPVGMIYHVVLGYAMISLWHAIFITAEEFRIERQKEATT